MSAPYQVPWTAPWVINRGFNLLRLISPGLFGVLVFRLAGQHQWNDMVLFILCYIGALIVFVPNDAMRRYTRRTPKKRR